MKKVIGLFLPLLIFILTSIPFSKEKDLEIQGKTLISQKPPFILTLPSEFHLIHSFSHPNPTENSLTRVFFLVKANESQVEEMLILQIADRINPQAGPIISPPLKSYTEKRMYSKGTKKKGEVEIDYLIQLMAWNPEAPSLEPIVKRGIVIPPHWALQEQMQFHYPPEHAILIRYSKDIHTFGLKVSTEGRVWEKNLISGNEKQIYEAFQKACMEMIHSLHIKNP
jgi:hypothetical protein